MNNTSDGSSSTIRVLELDKKDVFWKHTDSVLCCDIDPSKKLAVTGGVDDTAYVWNYETKQEVFECSGHKESVIAAAFNIDFKFVATGDLSGLVQVRDTSSGNQVFEYAVDEINWLWWHKSYNYVLFAGTSTGDIWMWNIMDPTTVKIFPSPGAPTIAGKVISDGLKIVSAYTNGSVKVFDLKTRESIAQMSDPSQNEIISLDVNPVNSIIVIGCIDSTVKIISATNCKILGTLQCKTPEDVLKRMLQSDEATRSDEESSDDEQMDESLHDGSSGDDVNENEDEPVEIVDKTLGETENGVEGDLDEEDNDSDEAYVIDKDDSVQESVESVMFSKCGNFLLAANISGSIFIWDVSTQGLRYELHTGHRISYCLWADDGRVITAGLDGVVRIYDSSLKELSVMRAHEDQILYMACRFNTLLSVSEDRTCRVVQLD